VGFVFCLVGFFLLLLFLTTSQCIGVKGGKPVHAPVQVWAAELHILKEAVEVKEK